MKSVQRIGKFALALASLVVGPACSAQSLTVRCVRGCTDPGPNLSLNLLMRDDTSASITLSWETKDDPGAGDREVLLYAGNPEMQDSIPARGPLGFKREESVWRATREFHPADLGRGTFLAVVTARQKGTADDPWGEHERILDWRPFRLLTTAEAKARLQGPPPGSAWSITVTPALLHARTGHGDLPRSQGGDGAVWWSLLGSEGDTSDLDLDGEYDGIPGLGVQVSTPWHTSSGEDWKKSVLDHLSGVGGHKVHFDGFAWNEAPDRKVPLGDLGPVYLRNYYAAITLHTMASVKSFAKSEFRGDTPFLLKPTYFSHETSARLKHPDDPRLWSSYSRREYGADRRLLAMLRKQIEREGAVPGLTGVQRDDGDGGSPTYTVGFYTEVRPWEEQAARSTARPFRAGIVGMDIVAARAGIGGLATRGSGGAGSLQETWCRVVGCSEKGERPLDLDRLPAGYRSASAVSSLGTVSGNLPLIDGSPEVAERGEAINVPARARFGVTAGLRAGVLMREGSLGYIKDMVPIDAYAQFIVRITVAMFPDVPIIANTDMTIPSRVELRKKFNLAPKASFWQRHRLLLTLLGLVALPLLVLSLVPGGLGLIRAALGLVVKVLRLIVDGLYSWLDRLRTKEERRP